MPFIRLFKSGFEEGIYKTPNLQESARTDSIVANNQKGSSEEKVIEINSDWFTMIGQILTHDFMKTKKAQLYKDKRSGCGFNCCNPKNDTKIAELIKANRLCLPIKVAEGDPCLQGNCLNYVRNCQTVSNCDLDSSPMLTNFHTPSLDAELIYNEYSLRHLEENGGKFDINNFDKMSEIIVGFDARSMQLPGLFIYLNCFCRFHNLIFDELKKFKGSFMSDTAIGFEARKFTTAVYQKIFKDAVVNLMRKFDAKISSIRAKKPFFTAAKETEMLNNLHKCYDPTINPQVSLEFNIALRLFHYFLRDVLTSYDEKLFSTSTLLRGKFPSDTPIFDVIDNLPLAKANRCGITHGMLDTSWNHGRIGPNVRKAASLFWSLMQLHSRFTAGSSPRIPRVELQAQI